MAILSRSGGGWRISRSDLSVLIECCSPLSRTPSHPHHPIDHTSNTPQITHHTGSFHNDPAQHIRGAVQVHLYPLPGSGRPSDHQCPDRDTDGGGGAGTGSRDCVREYFRAMAVDSSLFYCCHVSLPLVHQEALVFFHHAL